MQVFAYSVLDQKHPLGKFSPKYQNCQFKLNFGTLINSWSYNTNSWSYNFMTNSNKQNSVEGCSHILFQTETPFLGKFGPKNKISQFQLKFGTQAKSEYAELHVGVHFFCFIAELPLLVNKGKRSAIIVSATLTGVETLKQAAVVNMVFFFILLR